MTTDPAVTAAAEAIDGPGSTYLIQRGHVDIDDVARVVAAARPFIEAEVREQLLPEIARAVVAERHRIAAEIEAAKPSRDGYSDDALGMTLFMAAMNALSTAARIARGQA